MRNSLGNLPLCQCYPSFEILPHGLMITILAQLIGIRQRLVEVALAQCELREFLFWCCYLRLQRHGLFVGRSRLILALQLPIKITQSEKRLDGLGISLDRLPEGSFGLGLFLLGGIHATELQVENDIVRLQVKPSVREFFCLGKLFLTGVKACQRGVCGGRLGINGQGLLIELLSRGGVLLERIQCSQREIRLETFRIEFAGFFHRLEGWREILSPRIDMAQ